MSELARVLFAVCFGVAAGCCGWLLIFAWQVAVYLLGLLIAHLRRSVA